MTYERTMLLATFLAAIAFAFALGWSTSAARLPRCQEDELIAFNAPERDTYWCIHLDEIIAGR